MTRLLLSILIIAFAMPLSARTIHYVEVRDRYTRVTGLRELLEHLGHRPREIKPERLSRGIPTRGVLVIGSFATANEAVRNGLRRGRARIATLLRNGGLVIQLTQSNSNEGKLGWLPGGLTAVRGDLDYPNPVAIHVKHPLFRQLKPERWTDWEIKPPGWKQASSYMTATETFKTIKGFRILLARDNQRSFPSLVSARVGRGWLVLTSLAPDKVFRHGTSDGMKSEAATLMRTLINYYSSRNAKRHGFKADPPFESYPLNRRGVVFLDANRNGQLDPGESGLVNQTVHFGTKTMKTDATGRFQITVPPDRVLTVSIHLPADRVPTTPFFFRTNDPAPIEFGLAPREQPVPDRYSIVQITDTHVAGWRLEKDKTRLLSLASDLNRMTPKPAFVLHTGDITTSCRQGEWRTYLSFPKALKIPVFHLMGNHDISKGPDRADVYRQYLGPENYSFDYGPHRYIVGYHRYRGNPIHRWMVSQINASDRPVVLVIHHFPSTRFLKQIKNSKIFAIIHGDWHSAKVTKIDNRIWNINTPATLMGGLDHTPKSFRLLTMTKQSIKSELRYTGMQHYLRIASPAKRASKGPGIVVSAYDSVEPVLKVSFRVLGSDGRAVQQGELKRVSHLSYRGPLNVKAGRYKLEIEASGVAGTTWKTSRNIQLQDDTPSIKLGKTVSMFRRNNKRNGIVGRLGLPLKLRWAASTGGTIYLQSATLNKRGVLFISHEDRHTVDRRYAGVSAIRARDGRVLWRSQTWESVLHSPLLHDGRVLVQGLNGRAMALDQRSGKLLWKFHLNDSRKPYYQSYWAAFTPAIVKGRLLLTHPPAPVVIDPSNGRSLSPLEKLGREAFMTYSSPTLSGNTLFMGSLHHGIRAYRINSRPRTLWTTKKFQLSSTPVVSRGKLFVIGHRRLRVYRLSDGKLLHVHKIRYGYNVSSPIVDGTTVYYGSSNGRMIAMDYRSGETLWSFKTGMALLDTIPYRYESPTISSSPALAGNVLYFGGNDGKLYALNKSDGKLLWSYDLGSPVASSPMISGNSLFIGAYDGNLYAFVTAR